MKEIPLSQGKVAIVDDEDYEYLNQWKWCAAKSRYNYYAERSSAKSLDIKNFPRLVKMHRVIMNTPVGFETDHIDGDGLNNQKGNLRIVTNRENHHNLINVKKTSKYVGVSWDEHCAKWFSKIQIGKKQLYLGVYKNELDAATAYNVAYAHLIIGEHFPQDDIKEVELSEG